MSELVDAGVAWLGVFGAHAGCFAAFLAGGLGVYWLLGLLARRLARRRT